MRHFLLSICVLLIMASCSPEATVAPDLPAPTDALPTPTATPVPLPTPSPTPAWPVRDGGTLSPGTTTISKENLSQLTELAVWGKGIIQEIEWSADGSQIVIVTSTGQYGYDSTSFQRLDEKDVQLIEDPQKSVGMKDFDMSKGYSVQIFNAKNGSPIGSFQMEGFSQYWPELRYLPGSDIIVIDAIRNVQLRDGISYEILGEFRGVTYVYDVAPDGSMSMAEDYLSAIDVSKDRKMVATGQFDGRIVLRSGEGFADNSTLEAEGPVRFLSFSPDGTKLVSESNGKISVWDVAGASTIGLLPDTFISGDFFYDADHFGTGDRLGLTVKGDTLVYANKDNAILLDLVNGQQSGVIHIREGSLLDKQADGKFGHPEYQPISDVFLSADGQTLITVLPDRSYVWDVPSAQFLRSIARVDPNEQYVVVSVYSAADHLLLTGNAVSSYVRIWNTDDGSSLPGLKAWKPNASQLQPDGTHSLVISPDGKFVFSWSGLDGLGNLWEIKTQQRIMAIKIPASEYSKYQPGFYPVAISPDNTKLVFTYSLEPGYHIAKVYSIPDGKELYRILERFAVFSPDGSVIAASIGNNVIRFYDSATGKALSDVTSQFPNPDGFQLLYFSEDGKTLTAVSTNGTVSVWGVP